MKKDINLGQLSDEEVHLIAKHRQDKVDKERERTENAKAYFFWLACIHYNEFKRKKEYMEQHPKLEPMTVDYFCDQWVDRNIYSRGDVLERISGILNKNENVSYVSRLLYRIMCDLERAERKKSPRKEELVAKILE